MPEKCCPVCGNPIIPPRKVYCSPACAKQAKLEKRKRARPHRKKPGSPVYYPRICPDCGKEYMGHIKSVRCPDCQTEADRRNGLQYRQRRASGNVRKIGSTDLCIACGKPYTVSGSRQRYCSECASTEVTKNLRSISRTRYRETYSSPEKREKRNANRRKPWQSEIPCSVCGKPFIPSHPRQTICSDRCHTIRKRENQKRADSKRHRNHD